MNKKDELQSLTINKKYDVIALTEIYPKNITDLNISDIEWKMDGYKLFVSPSDVATRRGCLIYINDKLDAIEIENKKYKCVEYIQLGIHLKNGVRLLISCIYRSPSIMDTLCIDEIQEILTTSKIRNVKYDYRLCVGDFNFKEIDCENNSTNVGPNHMATKFLEMVRHLFISAC